MARGKHAGESRDFGDDFYGRRRKTVDDDSYLGRRSRVEDDDYYGRRSRVEENNYYGRNKVEEEEEYESYDNDEDEEEYDDSYAEEYEGGRRLSLKKVFITILIIFLIIEIIFGIRKFAKAKKDNDEAVGVTDNSSMASEVEGYKVLGKLEIEKIGVDQYILDSKEDNALKNGVCKLYGGSLNGYGNFSIAGHNYDDVFAKLNELENGDKIVVKTKYNDETTYEVKDTYSVEPDDLNALLQNESKVELTLITCENGSTKRLVVKAEKVN